MPSKKKITKKSRTTKKPASKKLPVKAAAKPAKLPVESVVTMNQQRWEPWIPVVVVGVLLVISILYAVSRQADRVTPETSSSQSSRSSASELRVVPGGSGTSSPQASDALQPQATSLQQAQPATQSAGGQNLQAQTSIR